MKPLKATWLINHPVLILILLLCKTLPQNTLNSNLPHSVLRSAILITTYLGVRPVKFIGIYF